MKKVIFLFIAVVTCMSCAKSDANQNVDSNAKEEVTNVESDAAYDQVEILPEFPGGIPELMNYLQTSLQYPTLAKERQWEGRTVCEFIIEEDGSIKEAKVIKSSGYQLLDVEALRVILSMPNWTPGRLTADGDSVRVKYCLPISFKLQ